MIGFILCLIQSASGEDLLRQLDSEDIQIRDQAAAGLRKVGAPAIAGLRRVGETGDTELSSRARDVLDLIRRDLAPGELANLEKALTEARTLRIRYAGKGTGETLTGRKGVPIALSGVLLLGEGNRASVTCRMQDEERTSTYHLISDGTVMFASNGNGGPGRETLPAPETLRRQIVASFLRNGAHVASRELASARLEEGRIGFRPAYPVEHDVLRWMEPDGTGASLAALLQRKYDDGASTLKSRLWYEPGSTRLLKRELIETAKREGAFVPVLSTTETYEVFEMNADIAPEWFEVPFKKK